MTSKQLESKVRRIIQEAGKRKIYKKAREIALTFSKEYGKEKIEVGNDHTNTDRTLQIYTGSSYGVIHMWNCHWGPMNIDIFHGHDEVFKGHSASRFDMEDARKKGLDWQFAKQGLDDYARVESYKPGPWERVLEMHEAERLLKAEREVKASLEAKKKVAAERASQSRPLTEEERARAAKFGIKV